MKSSGKFPASSLALLIALLAFPLARAADDVASPTQRQEAVDAAKKLLARRENTPVTADPFHPEAFNEAVAAMGRAPGTPAPAGGTGENPGTRPGGPRTDHDVLQSIAAGLKPNGFFVLSGQPTLVFGQKRVKAGGTVTITFEGTQYTLEIVNITPPNFTLRLNREEFTRTIK